MPSLFIKALLAFRKNHCCGVLVLALQAFANLLPVLWFLEKFTRARIAFYLGDIPANTATNRTLCRLMSSMAEVIIVNSEAVRRGFAQLGVDAQSIHVVYNGVEFDAIEANRLNDVAQPKFGWPKESIVVAYAGQLTPRKGILDFLSAAEVVHRAEPKTRFIIFGHANQQDEFMQLLLATSAELRRVDVLRFAGYSTNLLESYRNVDIQVVPSRHEEALGNVPIEAAAAGVPVIASNVGGITETIVHEKTGFLVEKEAPEQIAACIVRLAADREMRRSMGAAARLRAQHRFDAKKNAVVVEELMLSTLV
jgi:glycosyltransferase involved in cell wall biosynthesis